MSDQLTECLNTADGWIKDMETMDSVDGMNNCTNMAIYFAVRGLGMEMREVRNLLDTIAKKGQL